MAVGTESDVELCAGTLSSFDEHVVFVEEELGIARPAADMLEVYVVEDTSAWCRDVEACYIGGWVDATFVPSSAAQSVWHELVHQVVAGSSVGMTDRFLSEGLASAMGDDWCPPTSEPQWSTTPLLDLLGRDDVEFRDYPRGAAFVDFVRESYGTDSLIELAACVHRGDPLARVEGCFQRTFGRGVATLGREFEVASPAHHPNPSLCRGAVQRWPGDTWVHDVALGCEEPDVVNTFRHLHGRQSATLLEIPQPGWYELSVAGDGDASVELEPCFCSANGPRILAPANAGLTWMGDAGTHRVVVETSDPNTTRAQVVVRRVDRSVAPPL